MTCLKKRLLYAAAETYPLAPVEADRIVDWTTGPIPIDRPLQFDIDRDGRVDASAKVDRALVGEIDEGIVVAFRGTLAPRLPHERGSFDALVDWINNGRFRCDANIEGFRGVGVHSGFARSLNALWDGPDGVEAEVARLRGGDDGKTIYIAGHSKGGALANLAAWRVRKKWPNNPVKVLTVAAARAGAAGFARAYAAAGIDCLRYEVRLDLVPLLPPGADFSALIGALPATPGIFRRTFDRLRAALGFSVGYVPVGRRIVDDAPLPELAARWREQLRRAWFRRDLPTPLVIEAHLIAGGSRYAALICDGEGCEHDWDRPAQP